jgi:hypothetical protein
MMNLMNKYIFNIHVSIILLYKVNLDRGFKIYIKELTPWNTLEKIIIAQLVKKSHAFHGTPKIHYRVHKSRALGPIFKETTLVRTLSLSSRLVPQSEELLSSIWKTRARFPAWTRLFS